jgi:hypothetical protein
MSNSQLGLWDYDNSIESKAKLIMKLSSQSIQSLKDEIEKKIIKKRT